MYRFENQLELEILSTKSSMEEKILYPVAIHLLVARVIIFELFSVPEELVMQIVC